MIDLVCVDNPEEESKCFAVESGLETESGRSAEEPGTTRAIVPTIDLYSARVLLTLTQKMVEDAVDRRVSQLEERIEQRDREIMRSIRKIQNRMLDQQKKAGLPWWRKLFQRSISLG
ncbi:MAG: hypothetical protein K6T65_07020 [Peptococcaceae bacterium]|nr:hypothetical protein [Peptococcaceae bacterium]